MVELSQSFDMECDILDRDHQDLLKRVNVIIAAIEEDRAEECATLTPNLIKFAKQHFAREEALLVKIGYPDVEKHADHHHDLDHKMETILELAAAAGTNHLAGEKLKSELTFFLMDDIINADLDFKAYVKDNPGSTAG